MARFSVQVKSGATLAVDTGFGWLMASANNGFMLRRLIVGVVAGATTPTSQQVTIGINRVTTAGTTPTAGMTPVKLDPNSAAAGSVWNTAYSAAPTLGTADSWRFSFNTQVGLDLPWEGVEELRVAAGTTNGLVFINRDNALPTSHCFVLTAEFEE